MATGLFRCPLCAAGFRASTSLTGRSHECPSCRKAVTNWPVPADVEAEPDDTTAPVPEQGAAPWMKVGAWAMVLVGSVVALSSFDASPARKQSSVFMQGFMGVSLLIAGLCYLYADLPTASLAAKVKALAPLPGKAAGDIEEKLGPPKVRETTEDGQEWLTWVSPGLQITLAFKGGVCSRVVREVSG